MVQKILQCRPCKASYFTLNHDYPHVFVQSQWQSTCRVNVYYLLYRWLHALLFLLTLLLSLADFQRPVPEGQIYSHHYAKWFIYATHWTLFGCTLQGVIAACLVTEKKINELKNGEKYWDYEPTASKIRVIHKVYWNLHTMCATISFCITIVYWTTVFNKAIHPLDALNIMVHALNSVLMAIDLFIVAHPTRFLHFYIPLLLEIAYSVFTGFYFLAGGTDRNGAVYVYSTMNWTKPGLTIAFIVGGGVTTIIVHSICFGICRLRRCLNHKICAPSLNNNIKQNEEVTAPERVDLIV